MSTVDMMILGHLMEDPKNAYEMQKEFDAKHLNQWVKISVPSVYKKLIKLNERGFIDAKVIKEGEMPEKTIYTINQKGIRYFFELVETYSDDTSNIYFNFIAVVANLRRLDRNEGMKVIEKLKNNFASRIDFYQQGISGDADIPYVGHSIIALYKDMYELFYRWAVELQEKYESIKSTE